MTDGQRSHRPSPKRIREFRKRGEIALSRDLVSATTLAGGVIGVVASAHGAAASLGALTRGSVIAADGSTPPGLGGAALAAFGVAAGPALVGAALGAIAGTLGQLGWPPAGKRLSFDLGRLSPLANLRQMLSPGAISRRVAGALVKLAVVGAVVTITVLGLDRLEPVAAAGAAVGVGGVVVRVLLFATLAFAGVAAIDYLLARRRLLGRMRMSSDEVKREAKEQEGDPVIKGRRKRQMRELGRRRVAAAVKSADVVLVNPTHYAVALRYDDASGRAPVVVAKGVDEAAERIRELARQHAVPVLTRPPLARALHLGCPEGREIPVALYRAVAEVLAYVYRLRRRSS